jgi:hypothetical protein
MRIMEELQLTFISDKCATNYPNERVCWETETDRASTNNGGILIQTYSEYYKMENQNKF